MAALVAAFAALVGAPPALAAGKKACTISESRLRELSGIAATGDGYVVVNGATSVANRKRVFFLDGKCKLANEQSFRTDPRDPQDAALSPDGKTLWIADIGDPKGERPTVALWSMPVDGSEKATIHRLTYPDGAHDAKALLLPKNGIPYIITKSTGKSAIYAPAVTAAKLPKNTTDGTPMTKVGEITLPKSTTENRLGPPGRLVITGGAVSPDGSKVVLRTYADAFEWDVPGGDVVKALTGDSTPRATPLTSDIFGEAISYTADGAAFVTVSNLGDLEADTGNVVYSYAPASAAAKDPVEQNAGGGKSDKPSWFADLSLTDLMYLIGSVGVVGLILVVVGVVAILRFRRRPPEEDPLDAGAPVDPDGVAASGFASPVREAPPAARGGVYSARAGTEYGSAAGTTYGSPPGGPDCGPRSGGTYRAEGYASDPADDGWDDPRGPAPAHGRGAAPVRGRGAAPARGHDTGWDAGDPGWSGGHDPAWDGGGRDRGRRARRDPGWDGGAGWDGNDSGGWDARAGWDRPAPSSPAPAPPPPDRRGGGRGGGVYGGRHDPNYPPAYGDDQYDREPDPYTRY